MNGLVEYNSDNDDCNDKEVLQTKSDEKSKVLIETWKNRFQKFSDKHCVTFSKPTFSSTEIGNILHIPVVDELLSSEDENETNLIEKEEKTNVSDPKKPKIAVTGLLAKLPPPKFSEGIGRCRKNVLMVPNSVSRNRPISQPKPSVSNSSSQFSDKTVPTSAIHTSKEEDQADDDDVDNDDDDGNDDNDQEEEEKDGKFFSFFDSRQASSAAAPLDEVERGLLTAKLRPTAATTMGPTIPTQSLVTASNNSSSSAGDGLVSSLYVLSATNQPSFQAIDRLLPKREKIVPVCLVDVHQEDLTQGAGEELMKSISQDPEDQGYQKPDSSEDPGKLSARKHQITWLAYKAKEREFELQQMWAENRHTKHVTRSKYGF